MLQSEFKVVNALNATDDRVECKLMTSNALNYQLFSLESNDQTSKLFTYNKFIQNCVTQNTNSQQHREQTDFKDYFFTHQTVLESQTKESNQTDHLDLYVFDFRVIKNDVIYIDFINYDNLLIDCKQSNLVLYFATQQFVIFRLLNVPTRLGSCLSKLTILLNGKSQLNYIDSEHTIQVEVINSPLYFHFERVDDESIELASRRHWFNYLENLFQKSFFIENLFVFCQISHVQVDLNRLISNQTLYVNYLTQTKLNFLESNHLNQRCEVSRAQSLLEQSIKSKYENVFLFEFNDDTTDQKAIYVFIRECVKFETYFIVIYSQSSNKRIILDDYNCNLKIYVSFFLNFFRV